MIDRFFAEVFAKKIKERLDKNKLKKIERELFLIEGMSIKLSIEFFEKLHLQLKQIMNDSESFELQILDEICQIQSSKDKVVITILDKSLINELLYDFGDDNIRRILLTIMKNELVITDILKQTHVSKTSGYRIIEDLIIKGLIIETKKILSKSKKISKFKCIFEEIVFRLNNERILIEIVIPKKDLEKSSIMKILWQN